MQQLLSLKLLPEEAYNDSSLQAVISNVTGVSEKEITGWNITRRSIDARGKIIYVNISVNVYISEPYHPLLKRQFAFKEVNKNSKRVIIIGAGPAGLFAALLLLEKGIKPIVLERGKDVRSRRRDLALLNKQGILNPESNYCFGEGGAGTYSDGKLYTRSKKRGDIERILQLFVHFGAEEKILYEAHPHIGTNKLPAIISAMRAAIIGYGGEFYFEKKVTDLEIIDGRVKRVITADGAEFDAEDFILATGHSAGDIFELLHNKKLLISAKPFALGVRVEHPQLIIDNLQYYGGRRDLLPPASYSLVEQVDDKGVFSFCMCPGGIIAPASANINQLVVNGWSPSKRNNPFANSGMVVQVENTDAFSYLKSRGTKVDIDHPLLLYYFQKEVEETAYAAGGGNYVAPAQRMIDFVNKKTSVDLPECSYLPGIKSTELRNVLPEFISSRLAKAFTKFGKKMASRNTVEGYYTNEAVLTGVESRTSSPVKIPRDPINLSHPQLSNLYPCAEGAGYAGGIVSAAMDGERVASAISLK